MLSSDFWELCSVPTQAILFQLDGKFSDSEKLKIVTSCTARKEIWNTENWTSRKVNHYTVPCGRFHPFFVRRQASLLKHHLPSNLDFLERKKTPTECIEPKKARVWTCQFELLLVNFCFNILLCRAASSLSRLRETPRKERRLTNRRCAPGPSVDILNEPTANTEVCTGGRNALGRPWTRQRNVGRYRGGATCCEWD
jgi:hypothetical protein